MLPVMDTGNRMSQASRKDYLQRIYPRYQRASRPERQCILDEFCANCSYRRKHAMRLLHRPLPATGAWPNLRPAGDFGRGEDDTGDSAFDSEVTEALRRIA
jgi:hypothetical protein